MDTADHESGGHDALRRQAHAGAGHAAALSVVRHIVHLRRNLKDRAVDRAVVVVVDQKEVRGAIPDF